MRCCSSWLRNSVLVQTVLALRVRVLMTQYLATSEGGCLIGGTGLHAWFPIYSK